MSTLLSPYKGAVNVATYDAFKAEDFGPIKFRWVTFRSGYQSLIYWRPDVWGPNASKEWCEWNLDNLRSHIDIISKADWRRQHFSFDPRCSRCDQHYCTGGTVMCLICESRITKPCRCGWTRADAGEYLKAHKPEEYELFLLASPWTPRPAITLAGGYVWDDDSDDESIRSQISTHTPTFPDSEPWYPPWEGSGPHGHLTAPDGWTRVGANGKHK